MKNGLEPMVHNIEKSSVERRVPCSVFMDDSTQQQLRPWPYIYIVAATEPKTLISCKDHAT